MAAEPAPRPPAPTAYAELDGLQRLLAAVPLLTFAVALGLWAIFQLQTLLGFDVAAGGALSVDTLVAQGADSYDLAIEGGEIWRIVMAPLLHSSSTHLFGNLLAMVLIGVMLEPMIGRGWCAAILLASGLGGEIGSLVANPGWLPGVGASGAITGWLAAGFVMSFLTESAEEGWRMQKRALFFGLPALLPLIWSAHGHVNYYAHLGGALAGGVTAFVLSQTWDRAEFRPPFHRLAGGAAVAYLALALPATAFAALHYQARRAEAAQFIPSSELAGAPLGQLARRAPELMQRYPNDPMAKILSAVRNAETGGLAAGEADLRAALEMEIPRRPWAERPIHTMAQGFLAMLVNSQGRKAEARRLAEPLCAADENPAVTEMLHKERLCRAQ
jgi:membrane associated rhomboid family serine protease